MKALLEQFGRFLLGGTLGAVVYFGAFFLLTRVGRVQYKLPNVVIVISLLNATLNFMIQKFWAFNNREIQNIPGQFAAYLSWWFVYTALNTWLVTTLVKRWHFRDWIALIVARVILGVASYAVTAMIFD